MISTNHQKASAQIVYVNRLEANYRELLKLRERVRAAEAAVSGRHERRASLTKNIPRPATSQAMPDSSADAVGS